MQTFTAKQLEGRGVNIKSSLTIQLNEKKYKKTKIILRKYREEIAKFCDRYESENLDVLLVEHKSYFAIWVEQQTKNEIEPDVKTNSTKKVMKRYRGIKYEEEVPIVDRQPDPKFTSNKQKKQKYYRGRAYE